MTGGACTGCTRGETTALSESARPRSRHHRASGPVSPAVRRCSPGDGPSIAEVMAAAFHDKLGAIFGSHIAGGLRFLASEYARPRRLSPVYLAEVDGRVVGAVEVMLGREKRAGGLALFRAMRREMGWPGAMRAAFGFSLLVADTRERDCAYVEFLGVLPEFRGRGIGRALLDRVAHKSRLAGKPRLMLEVAATNRAAIRLYSRFGFRRVRTYRSRLTRWLFGVGEWEAWELPL